MRIVRIAAMAALVLALGCDRGQRADAPTWRSDCPPVPEEPPMSLEAARTAHRIAARRHAFQLHEAASPGYLLRTVDAVLDPGELRAGRYCVDEVADLGRLVFEHEFDFADGLGGGDGAIRKAGPFRRVHDGRFGGPETIACTSCHWIGGPNGAGAETDNAFLVGDGERPGSADARNPPALLGLGVVQALAREMTVDLQRQRAELVRAAGKAGADRESHLVTKGVDYGVMRVTARGDVDATGLRGVDADLVVKPFGWKGTLPTIAGFATDALQVHLGIQNAILLAAATAETAGSGRDPADPDGDGKQNELGRAPFVAMVTHLALLEMPIVEPLIQDRNLPAAAEVLLPPTTTSFVEDFQRGRRRFRELGCAECHRPMLVLDNPMVELEDEPPIDLSRAMRRPALTYDADLGGYPVWLFSDLRRHDMGSANRARHPQLGVAVEQYLTPRLWGVADSAPYLHDGRAPSLDYAIAGHDGEGAAARDAYAALDRKAKGDLRVYLMSLRRAPRLMVP
jgi:hypothetical protein